VELVPQLRESLAGLNSQVLLFGNATVRPRGNGFEGPPGAIWTAFIGTGSETLRYFRLCNAEERARGRRQEQPGNYEDSDWQ
jgi:hypothetical protein